MNRRIAPRLMSVMAAGSLAGCDSVPMNYLRTSGPAADPIASLGWGLIIVSSLVVIIVTILVWLASARARLPAGSMAEIGISRRSGGLRWVYVGTGVSTVVLFGIVVWTLLTLAAVAGAPRAPALTIEIRAHQWWWEVRYMEGPSDRTFVTANELHVPVGAAVQLRLIGDDVIHSFWIPALAGKTDVIPGQTNLAWFQADAAGVYRGQCTEYCGVQHAHMAEFVYADSPADFARWWAGQLGEAASPDGPVAQRGESVFLAHCAACHTVRGAAAGGIVGPDLTHLMSRKTLGAGALPNEPAALERWVADAQSVKPGCRMPTLELPRPELEAVTAYLQTLR
jgi:cytochrome c oxidase subunit 2